MGIIFPLWRHLGDEGCVILYVRSYTYGTLTNFDKSDFSLLILWQIDFRVFCHLWTIHNTDNCEKLAHVRPLWKIYCVFLTFHLISIRKVACRLLDYSQFSFAYTWHFDMIDTEEKFVTAVKAAVLGLIPNNISYDLLRRFKFELDCF